MSCIIVDKCNYFLENKMDNVSGGPINKNDMFKWKIKFDIPNNSDYEGRFNINITFPKDYSNSMTICRFLHDVFHPNINEEGCLLCKMFIESFIYLLFYIIYKYPYFYRGYNNKQVDNVDDFFQGKSWRISRK